MRDDSSTDADCAPRQRSPGDELREDPPYLVEFDSETDSVTETIVTAVAEMADADPTGLDPLYDVVDPEALDDTVRSVARRRRAADLEFRTVYHGYTVTVHSYGVVEVSPRDGRSASAE